MKYTYHRKFAAHYARRIITIPDQVAENQQAFNGKTFPAIDANGYPYNSRKIRVRLDGNAYGLHTSGTGDPVCRAACLTRSTNTALPGCPNLLRQKRL